MTEIKNLLKKPGILYLCATPIGNLEDITLRVLRVLKEVDYIAAEDTRHTRKLLTHYDIHAKLISYHEHNKKVQGKFLISLLLEGKNIALVSDAGMPGISDPGHDLVLLALEKEVPLIPLPGPSAFLSALVVSGLPTDKFVFEGFLPPKTATRKKVLEGLTDLEKTIIFYEAPHRILKTLKDILEIMGDRKAAAVRELTKKFEEIIRGRVSELIRHFETKHPKGEFTLIISGAEVGKQKEDLTGFSLEEHVREFIEKGFDKKEAIKKVAAIRNLPKREVYNALIQNK